MDSEKKIIIVLSAALVLLSLITALLIQQRSTLSGPRAPSAIAPMAVPTSPDGLMHTLSGRVTAVGSNSLTIEATLPGNTSPSSVTVTVAAGTPVTLQTQKDPQTLAKEMQAYQKQFSAGKAGASSTPATMPAPPMPFVSKTILLSDVAVGMTVTVTPASNTKQDATTITAQSITTFAMPSTSATLPPSPTAGTQGGNTSAPAIPPSPTAGTQAKSTPPPPTSTTPPPSTSGTQVKSTPPPTAPTPPSLPPSPTAK